MSASPNQQTSPPSSIAQNEAHASKVVVPLPVLTHSDEIYCYIFVKGSLYASDTHVFGLENQEVQALAKKFNSPCKQVENGVMYKNTVCQVINSLAQLGYRVVSSCGETETIFTLQREV